MDLKQLIRNVPDFPVEGIQFKDVTTLLKDGDAFAHAVDLMYDPFRDEEITKIAGIEARGFIFAAAMAYKLNLGFIPIRKPGKLPAETVAEEYVLEYGKNVIEMHVDAVTEDDRVLVVDDLLATGGTAAAACRLIEKLNGTIVGVSFLIELTELKGREQLAQYPVHSLIQYPI